MAALQGVPPPPKGRAAPREGGGVGSWAGTRPSVRPAAPRTDSRCVSVSGCASPPARAPVSRIKLVARSVACGIRSRPFSIGKSVASAAVSALPAPPCAPLTPGPQREPRPGGSIPPTAPRGQAGHGGREEEGAGAAGAVPPKARSCTPPFSWSKLVGGVVGMLSPSRGLPQSVPAGVSRVLSPPSPSANLLRA